MRMGNKGPHGRPWIWLMAVIVICLAPVMDPIAADNILKRGLNHLLGLDEAEHAETEPDVQPAYRGKDASAMTCETSTR